MSSISILILGYDPYSDIWPIFDYYFKKANISNPSYFVSSEASYVSKCGIINVKTHGDMSFSTRLNTGLNQISGDYVLLILEDYLVFKWPDDEYLKRLQSEIESTKPDYVLLQNFISKPKIAGKSRSSALKYALSKKEKYLASLQPAIWKKESLLKFINDPVARPWDFEVGNCYRGKNRKLAESLSIYYIGPNIFNFVNLVDKREIAYDAYKIIKKDKLLIDRPIQSLPKYILLKLKRRISNMVPSFIKKSLSEKKDF